MIIAVKFVTHYPITVVMTISPYVCSYIRSTENAGMENRDTMSVLKMHDEKTLLKQAEFRIYGLLQSRQ